jgi:PAS domain S-box-containing protein
VSDPLDLLTPEAVARLRHSLRTPLNHILGYAEIVYRQAKNQGASAEMELMDEVVSAGRNIDDMISEAFPPSSHVGHGSIPRLQLAMQGCLDRIAGSIARFQQVSQGACDVEVERIRDAARQLFDFARRVEPRMAAPPQAAPGRVFEMPTAGAPQPAEPPPRKAMTPGGRILVVDDDVSNRDILEHRLSHEGFFTASEPDGSAAIARLRREHFDLVLLDIFMPVMDGFQVLTGMKANPELREIPVIVLSAADDQEHVVRSIELGADDFLSKPFDPVVLRARIGAVLRRRKAEADKAEISRRMESLLESSGEGIFGVDAIGVCTFVNRAAVEMLGHPRESLLGRNLHQVIHHSRPDGRPYPQTECPISAVRQTGLPSRGRDEWFFRADGSSFPIEFSAYPIRREGGWEGIVVSFSDISERKQNEERLLQTAKLDSLEVLAGGIAHEFNNILTGIMGNAALALETIGPRDHNRFLLSEVVRASERAADLTRQVLAFAGKGQFVLEAVDLSESIRAIAELLRASVPRDARVEFHLASGLPTFHADPRQIQQLAFNLVINAGEATEGRRGAIRVETGVRDLDHELAGEPSFGAIPPGRYVFLAVVDNGAGMDAVLRSRVFDPFFSTKFAGRGLGLAAAMGIARAHHGAIRVESEPGRGSRFEILFPV